MVAKAKESGMLASAPLERAERMADSMSLMVLLLYVGRLGWGAVLRCSHHGEDEG